MLLDIADAWEARAVEAESKGPKSDGGRDPSAPSVVPDAIISGHLQQFLMRLVP
jgi:hypothetical protein